MVILLSLISLLSLSSCSKEKKITSQIQDNWKIKFGDNPEYSKTDYDDQDWQICETVTPQKFPQNVNYMWMRKKISLPASLNGKEAYIIFGRSNTAIDVYADGVYIGSKGHMPPDTNIRIEQMTGILIPSSCIHGFSVQIALKVYSPEKDIDKIEMYLGNEAESHFQNLTHNILNQRMFIIMAAICAFMLVFSFSQFFALKDLSFLFYTICLLFITYYFWDLGFDTVLINYNIHRVLSRCSLALSMTSLVLFLNRFFNRPHFKKILIGCIAIDAIALIAFIASIGNNARINTLFTVMLIPVFGAIIYGYIATIQSFKTKLFGAKHLLIGFIIGSLLAMQDIIYQVMGKIPFVWLQGVAFFAIDLSIFIALVERTADTQRKILRLAEENNQQKNKMESILANAKAMSVESSAISSSLQTSVLTVYDSASGTMEKIALIRKALDTQTQIRQKTAQSVTNLASFLKDISTKFTNQTKLITHSAEGTRQVIHGIQDVAEGISTAADFTSSLSGVTKNGTADMKKLTEVMGSVQDSSKEILGVVTTLDDFAQQTNLLAMNASIEAAHSGEFGKGFAVIAREIKDLASKTSQWSAKIGDIITSVMDQISQSVELGAKVNGTLEKISSGAQESAQKVMAAREAIQAQQEAGAVIAREALELSEMAEQMRNSVEKQNEFVSGVLDSMNNLSLAAEEVNKASVEISNGTILLSQESANLTDLAQRTSAASTAMESLMAET